VAKISVSLDDDLVAELKDSAGENVSAFVAGAIRRQLDRQHLLAFLVDLDDQHGPISDQDQAEAAAAFDAIVPPAKRPGREAQAVRARRR
jgi:post-segregation antitoxin (ccd killing protein)